MRWHLFTVVAIFVLALAIRLLYMSLAGMDNLSRFDGGDYHLYEIGAEEWLRTGTFENSLFLVRPPGFSLMIAVLGLRSDMVLAFNVAVGALTAGFGVVLARQFGLGLRMSLLVGALLALEPASVVYSVYLGAEAPANLLLLLMLIAFLESMRRAGSASLLWMFLAAVFLVASAYVRPAAYLLWIVLVGIGLLMDRSRWRVLLLFGALSLLGIGAWIAHNGAVFGNPTFSTIGIYNLLYYRAVSVESLGSGAAVEDTYIELSRRVEGRMGRDTSVVTPGTRHGHYAVTADLQPVMQAVAFEVFQKYPLVYLATIPLGMYRILLSLNSGLFWLQGLALVVNMFLLVLAALGLWVWWRARDFARFWMVFLICGYFIAGTLLVQTSGIDVRARTMVTPLLAVAALTGLHSTSVGRKLKMDEM